MRRDLESEHMVFRVGKSMVVVGAGLGFAAFMLLASYSSAQGQATTYRAPRTADGKPNLAGIWEALNEANWDIEPHAAKPGPPEYGAMFSEPAGVGIIEGDQIQYRPEA